MMKIKIKAWKVEEIRRSMSRYGDRYDIYVEGQKPFTPMEMYVEDGYLTIINVEEIVKETEKAICINIDGFSTWCPKSAIIIL